MATQYGEALWKAVNVDKTVDINKVQDKYKKQYLSYGIENNLLNDEDKKQAMKKYDLSNDGSYKTKALETFGAATYGSLGSGVIDTLSGVQNAANTVSNALYGKTGNKFVDTTKNIVGKATSIMNPLSTLLSANQKLNEITGRNNLTAEQVIAEKDAIRNALGINQANQYAQERASENKTNAIANFGGQVVGGLVPTLATAYATGGTGVLPQVFSQTMGGKSEELLKSGDAKTLEEAQLKSLPYAGAGALIESLGGIGAKDAAKELGKGILKNAAEEGTEEVIEDIIGRALDLNLMQGSKEDVRKAIEENPTLLNALSKAIYGTDSSVINTQSLAQSFVGGALGGGIYGGIGKIANRTTQNIQPTIQNQENVQPIQQQKGNLTNINTGIGNLGNLETQLEQINAQNGQISNNINSNELSQQVDTINQNNLETSLKNDLNESDFSENEEKIQIKEKHTDKQKKVIEEYHNSTDSKLMDYINETKNAYRPTAKHTVYKLKKINSKLANTLSEQLGYNIENYDNEIDNSTIWHIEDEHGKNGSTNNVMENDVDLARIQYVIDNFDNAIVTDTENYKYRNKNGSRTKNIKIEKQMDGVYYVIEAAPDSKAKTMHIVSAYIDTKKSSLSSADMQENSYPQQTSETFLDSTTNNSIPQTDTNMQVQNENTNQPIKLNMQMFSGESDLEKAKNVIQEGQGQERLKSFYETANESEILNDEAKKELAIKRASDGTYYQKSMQQAKDEANEFIHTLEARDEYSQYEKAVDLIKRNELTNTGIESAILTEAVNYFQNQGDYERASQIIEDIEELTQKSGRNIQYLNAWRSLGPRGKWRFVERAVEKYNQTNTGKNKPITITEEDRTNFETSLANFEKELENNIDNTKQELIDNGYFNNKLEKISSEMILNDMTLSNEELKDAHTKEEMMKIFNRGDSSILKKVSTYQTISHLLNTSTFSRNFISNVAFKNLEKIAQKFNKVILGDYSVVDLKLNEQGQLAVKKAKSKATKKTALDILLGIEGIDNTRHTKTTSGTVKNALPSFKNKVLNTAEKGLALELKVPDERTKADVRETIIQQFKQKLGEKGYKKNQKEIEQYADEQAKYVTFQDDTALSKLMKNFKDLLNNGSEFGIGDFLVKYTQVPANVVSRAIEYSPLGALKAVVGVYDIQNKVRTGKMSIVEANKRATKLGRSLTGTALMGLGILLSKYGILTSNKEDDEEIKNLLKDAGVTEGNINISQIKRLFDGTYDGNNVKEGDITFTIDWLQPASMIINNGAILYRDLYETDNSGNVLWDIAENTLDLPSNQSLSTVLKAVQYKSKDQDIGEAITYGVGQALGDSVAGTLIPSFIRHWSNAIDPASRNVYANKSDKGTFSQYLAQPVKKTVKNIPFASKTLEPNITAEGKEKTYFDGGTILNYLIQSSPLRVTKVDMIEGTEALKDIMTLEDGTTISTTSNMPLRYAPNKTQYTKDEEGNKIILSDKDKTEYMTAYSKYYIENYLKYLDKIKDPKTMTDKQKENVAKQLGNINQKAKKHAEKEALSNN